ncbi:MAG: AraC family transcriptional regulator [Balneolales bacterium]
MEHPSDGSIDLASFFNIESMKNIPIRSILPPKIDELDSFRIFSISEILMGKNMNQALHRHDFYFILLVTRGTGIHEIDFVTHQITDNTISIMRPGQIHQLELKADSKGYWLAFDKDFEFLSTGKENTLLRKATSRNFYNLDKNDVNALSSIFQIILSEYRSKQISFEHAIKASLEILLIHFLRYQQKDQIVSQEANQYQQEKLQKFLDLLEANISTKKQTAAYADMVHLSPFQLNSITKNLLGKTVSELIKDQILLESKRYLLGTPNQVSQIAFQLGYMDVSYFIRFFKKEMGVTPEAFRKNYL